MKHVWKDWNWKDVWKDSDWKDWLLGAGKIGIALVLVYLGYTYLERWSSAPVQPNQPAKVTIHPDLYVYLPKSYVSGLESARKLVGKPLWVREGYRWNYQPGDKTLGPIEKIVPSGVRAIGANVVLEFEREGESCTVPISVGDHFYVDEVFFSKDPRELYNHWTDEDWQKVEAHKVEVGMTETQVNFAAGAGQIVRSSPGGKTRIVEYSLGTEAGVPPKRVTFHDGIAGQVEPLSGVN